MNEMILLEFTATKTNNVIEVDLQCHGGLSLSCLKDLCIFFRNPDNRIDLFSASDGFVKFSCMLKPDVISEWDVLEYCLHGRLEEISFSDFKKSLDFIIRNFDEYFYRIDLRYNQEHGKIIKNYLEKCLSQLNAENYRKLLFQRDFESYYRQFVKHVFTNTIVVFEHFGFNFEEIIDLLEGVYKNITQNNEGISYSIDFANLYFKDNYGKNYA